MTADPENNKATALSLLRSIHIKSHGGTPSPDKKGEDDLSNRIAKIEKLTKDLNNALDEYKKDYGQQFEYLVERFQYALSKIQDTENSIENINDIIIKNKEKIKSEIQNLAFKIQDIEKNSYPSNEEEHLGN